MTTSQDLNNLISRDRVDENWVCTLCEEGQQPNDHLVMHTCGVHIFYCSCLTFRIVMNDPVCSVCFITGNPNFSLVNNIKVGANYRNSKFCDICVSCRNTIEKYEAHIQLCICKHRLHKSCAMDQILENGITLRGKINCPLCHL